MDLYNSYVTILRRTFETTFENRHCLNRYENVCSCSCLLTKQVFFVSHGWGYQAQKHAFLKQSKRNRSRENQLCRHRVSHRNSRTLLRKSKLSSGCANNSSMTFKCPWLAATINAVHPCCNGNDNTKVVWNEIIFCHAWAYTKTRVSPNWTEGDSTSKCVSSNWKEREMADIRHQKTVAWHRTSTINCRLALRTGHIDRGFENFGTYKNVCILL